MGNATKDMEARRSVAGKLTPEQEKDFRRRAVEKLIHTYDLPADDVEDDGDETPVAPSAANTEEEPKAAWVQVWIYVGEDD